METGIKKWEKYIRHRNSALQSCMPKRITIITPEVPDLTERTAGIPLRQRVMGLEQKF